MFVADNLAVIANQVFARDSDASGLMVPVGLLAFCFQIYGDFSGYSDIARGTAKCLGFDLMVNFDLPYVSKTPSEFWQRWHISLSSWLRDYLYIPLGGNRKGSARTYWNLLVTMLLGGLWHGAAWTYVIWGAYQGAILMLYRPFELARKDNTSLPIRSPAVRRLVSLCHWTFMFLLTNIGWLIFRAQFPGQIGELAARAGVGFDRSVLEQLAKLTMCLLVLLPVQFAQCRSGDLLVVRHWRARFRIPFYFLLFYSIMIGGVFGAKEFIYFQF